MGRKVQLICEWDKWVAGYSSSLLFNMSLATTWVVPAYYCNASTNRYFPLAREIQTNSTHVTKLDSAFRILKSLSMRKKWKSPESLSALGTTLVTFLLWVTRTNGHHAVRLRTQKVQGANAKTAKNTEWERVITAERIKLVNTHLYHQGVIKISVTLQAELKFITGSDKLTNIL